MRDHADAPEVELRRGDVHHGDGSAALERGERRPPPGAPPRRSARRATPRRPPSRASRASAAGREPGRVGVEHAWAILPRGVRRPRRGSPAAGARRGRGRCPARGSCSPSCRERRPRARPRGSRPPPRGAARRGRRAASSKPLRGPFTWTSARAGEQRARRGRSRRARRRAACARRRRAPRRARCRRSPAASATRLLDSGAAQQGGDERRVHAGPRWRPARRRTRSAVGRGHRRVGDEEPGGAFALHRVAQAPASCAAALASSRLPVGSSASTSDGRCTSARAIATRCISPPESDAGLAPGLVAEAHGLQRRQRPAPALRRAPRR